jgi:hypothetical protein
MQRFGGGLEPLPASSLATLLAKFNPDQPRVPGGNPDGGQWTSGAYAGSAANADEGRVLTDENPDELVPGAQYAQGDRLQGYPVDLRDEDNRGGHTIERHVAKSFEYLTARVQQEARLIVERGDGFEGLSVGSFSSLDAATRLVNSTIAQNRTLVDAVTNDTSRAELLTARFSSITGYEAHLQTFHSRPNIRHTYGVGVFIVRDPKSDKGYRVQSAFPLH